MTTEKVGKNVNLPLIARSRIAVRELRDDLLKRHGGVVTAKQVGELLCLEARSVDEKRVRHELLALHVGEGFLYPVCQLDDGQVVKGLGSILSILYGDDEYVDSWLAFQF